MRLPSYVLFSSLLLLGVALADEDDLKSLEEHIESVVVDENVYAPGVRDVHRYVKEYREVKKYDVPPEEQVIELLHTIDFTKSGNNKFSKLGVLLDKFYTLTKGGVPFADIQAAIPQGSELSQALIGVHKLRFEKRGKGKAKASTSSTNKKKRDPNVVLMELMGHVLSGKTDLQFVDKVLLFLKEEPGFAISKGADLATNLGFISKTTSKAITENLVPIFQSDVAGGYVEGFYNMTMAFFRSPSGERLIGGLPEVMTNPTAERAIKFLKNEIEWNTELFFDSLENSDYKDNVLKTLSSYISKAISQGETLLNTPSEKGLLLMNGLFLSQGIPAYDPERPVHSLGMAVNKGIRLFTTFRFDVSPYVDTLEGMFKELKESQQWRLFFSLDDQQRTTAVMRFIDDELSEPISNLWDMHSHMSKNDKWVCAPRFICLLTEEAKKHGGEAKQVGTSVLSMGLGLVWSDWGINGEFWSYYEAVWNGISLECGNKYPIKDDLKDCDTLPWMMGEKGGNARKKMELNFDKVEL